MHLPVFKTRAFRSFMAPLVAETVWPVAAALFVKTKTAKHRTIAGRPKRQFANFSAFATSGFVHLRKLSSAPKLPAASIKFSHKFWLG